LVVHLAGDYPEACERRRILFRRVKEIEAEAQGQTVRLGPESLGLWGFGPDERALPSNPLLAFNLLEEYFIVPQKLLFFKVSGLKALSGSPSSSLVLRFRLHNLTALLAPARPEDFLLNAVPAINVFPHPAHPFSVDHRRVEYLLAPQDQEEEKLEIFAVDEVVSRSANGQSKVYEPFERFYGKSQGLYRVVRRVSPITGRGEHYLSFIYQKGQDLSPETISATLRCHNGPMTDYLRTGEICAPTDSSPAMVSFANIIPPTRACPPLDHDWRLWRLLSHLQANLSPTLSAYGLKEILGLHVRHNDPDLGRSLSNRKRIEAVEGLAVRLEDFFIKGRPYRGSQVEVTVDPTGFADLGDLDLFGEVLDHFFGLFHQINAYSRLDVKIKGGGQTLAWPPRLGLRRLA
jgi:type VI secretion system protein ImpG